MFLKIILKRNTKGMYDNNNDLIVSIKKSEKFEVSVLLYMHKLSIKFIIYILTLKINIL